MTLAQRRNHLLRIFNCGIDEGLIPEVSFCAPDFGELRRTTLVREAFDDREMELILRIFRPLFQYANRVANGYRRTGVGMNPTRSDRRKSTGKNEVAPKPNRRWRDWDNVVWYFENRMNCMPVPYRELSGDEHSKLLGACGYFGGLVEIYRRLGVTVNIDVHLIAPLAFKLCWETGLNPETLLTLKRDCFHEEHALTRLPYLRYYKARSTGEKDLHLGLFDFASEVQVSLEYKQATVIRRTIELIRKLTAPLVERADPGLQSYLFLYEAGAPGLQHKIVRLNVKAVSHWTGTLRRRLKKGDGIDLPAVFTLGRFRPTKITQLVRQGKDFFDVQVIAGHRFGSTTLKYLASHQIEPKAQKEVAAALQKIHKNKQEFEEKPKPYATEETAGTKDVIYKAVLCDCKDVFNPPANITKNISLKKDQSCTYFNMCLTCPNALILKEHLPRLIAYKHEIEIAIASGLSSAPNSKHYEKALAVIDGILLEFPQEDIEWAKEMTQAMDFHSDPLTYRAVSGRE
jgi:integrase